MPITNTTIIIGREAERATLDSAFRADSAQLLAVVGRWRVGKTFFLSSALGHPN